MVKNVLVIAVSMLSIFARPATAQGIPVYDAAALAQWVVQLEAMAEQYGVSVEALLEQQKLVKSLETRLEQSLNVDGIEELDDFHSAIDQTRSTIGAVSGMVGSVQDLTQRLQSTFGSEFGDADGMPSFESVMKTTKDTVRGALVTGGTTLDRIPQDARRINDLARQSQNATGTLQAQQAGNQINAELAHQILKLRQELATQAIATNTTQLAEQQRRESAAQVNVLFGGAPAKEK